MISPLQLAAGGALLIAAGALINARLGARMRAGRLLAGVQPHTPTEALASTDHAYVAINGSVDAAEAFEDENHRPLVYRRERVLISDGRSWREIDRAVRSVPFSLSDATSAIAIDVGALDEGLIVIERRWDGSVAELHAAQREYATSASAALVVELAASDPERGARLILEQISTLDRATAAGGLAGGQLTAGPGGRPLILTTLERGEALRILGAEKRWVHLAGLAALLLFVLGALLCLAAVISLLATPLSGAGVTASPTPTPETGDARTGGTSVGLGGLVSLLLALTAPFALAGLVALLARAAIRMRR